MLTDLTHALRALRKRPGFMIAALATLAIGIGANVTVFSIVNAMLLRPLPFGERSDRIVTLHATLRDEPEDWGWGDSELSYPDLRDYRAVGALDGLSGYLARNFTLSGGAQAERVQGGSVTPDLFGVLGVEPMLGRLFVAEDAAAPGLETVVLLTHGLWTRRYGGDPSLVGRTVIINDRARTVVGVMPAGFRFPERDELYMPLRIDAAPRGARNLNAIGLLNVGRTLAQAQSELDAVAARLASEYPDSNTGVGVRVLRFRDSQLGAEERQLSLALMGAVALVLLIVCANLANLLLVRGAGRQREIAVRVAMGASRGRVLSAVLAESIVLSVLGAALGLLGSQWALDLIRRSIPEDLPYWLRFDVDARVLGFTAGAAVLAALAAGLLPAWRATRVDPASDLRDSSRGLSLGPAAQRVQSALAVAQVALCLSLLVGASLMIRSFLALQHADLGFDHRPLLTARAYLAGDAFDAVPARAAFFSRAVDAVRALPGVLAAAATTSIPGDDGGGTIRVVIDGRINRADEIAASSIGVTPGIFDALGVTLVSGRTFSAAEAADPLARVTVVNAALARRLWPEDDAVDRRVGVRAGDTVIWYRVVGVAPDVHYEEIGEETDVSRLNLYVPYAASGARTMAFLARVASAPERLVQPLRQTLLSLHANLPLYEVMPMSERRRFTTWEQRFYGQMMGTFAAVAVLLATVGVYALLAYAARRRAHEIGIRLALGAAPHAVVRLFVRQAGVIGLIGIGLGLVLGLAVARLLSNALFAVDPFDPVMFAVTAVVLFSVVLLAAYVPARRAARIDPVDALRAD